MNVTAGRTIAIGDVHGCSAALDAVVAAIEPTRDDTLVLLGDLVDRGPDSRGVLDSVLELRRRCRVITIRGNHDEMMLASRVDPRALAAWLQMGGDAALESYGVLHPMDIPPAHLELLRGCVDLHETDRHFFAHGSYDPRRALDDQPWAEVRWASIRDDPPGPHRSGKTAVLGHTAQRDHRILDLGHLICIDTRCHGGGWLTALEVATGRTWQADREGRCNPTPPRLPPR